MKDNLFDFLNLSKEEARLINPQVLAFIGDSVYSLYVRNYIFLNNLGRSGELHKLATNYEKASAQSEVIENFLDRLYDDEMEIFKRARNYKTHSSAKNSSIIDYHKATGFEAVIGYLYLSGDYDRLNEILKFSTE